MIRFAALTHPGNQLSHNEDAVAYDVRLGLWLVADGMGGHAAGEVASQIATEVILKEVAAGAGLPEAILAAHRSIVAAAAEAPARAGMGSTIVALLIAEQGAVLSWIGDSRAYRWRGGRLTQLSKDHSVLQELIDAGTVSAQGALDHPKRNMITQVLGHGDPRPAEARVAIEPDDWLLLCSDGLTDVLDDAQIARILKADHDLERVAQDLIEAVCRQKPRDNVSVVLVEPQTSRRLAVLSRGRRWVLVGLLAAIAAFIVWLSS